MLPYRTTETPAPLSRRHFLVTSTAAAGLALGYRLAAPTAANAQSAAAQPSPFQSYVEIAPDNRIVITSSQFEMGQGAYFGVATLVMEELQGDWAKVDVVGGAGNPALFGNVTWGGTMQGTGGSSSMASSWDRYRKAGAAARMMLVSAAAKAWNVPAAEISVSSGVLTHSSGKRATYGEMAQAAAQLPVPADIKLKPKAEWKQIGSDQLKRYDSRAKSTGKQTYTIDLKLDGMLTAVMIHPPKFGAKVKSFDVAKAKALDGIVDVVQVPRGIAVVGRDMWTALKGRDLVTVEWDDTAAEKRGSAQIRDAYLKAAKATPVSNARNDGDAVSALASAAKVVEGLYEFPFLVHASMEPLNAVARKGENGVIEVWGGHQAPDTNQAAVAALANVTPDKVRLHVLKSGGSFGRRSVGDADIVVEAVAVAQALGWKAPVKVQWTRENDMRGGRYRPAYVHAIKGGLDKDGKLIALHDHVVGQSILAGSPFEGAIKNGVDPSSVEGVSDTLYAIPNVKVDLTTTDVKVPVMWWRSVGSTHTAYVVESFMDELASAAKRDPVEFRLAMLEKQPRHAAVLKLAAEKAGWSTKLPPGRFRGIALHKSFSTFVAEVAEITFKSANNFTVDRVVCAVDCGIVINPDQVRAQMEGGIGFGLGAILQEELTLGQGGVVDQDNFDTYTPLRINQMPKVEVYIVDSSEPPTGVGEPGVPPIGPAVANALRAATGKRMQILPLSKGLSA